MLQNDQLNLAFTKLALRYERKTAAIKQSALFILVARNQASSNTELQEVIEGFEKYLSPHSLNFTGHFYGLLLVSLISEVEIFFVDVLKALIIRYPKKIGGITFRLAEVLESSTEELVLSAAEDYLNRLMYKKPVEYLEELTATLALEKHRLENLWPSYVEAKARRDLGIHNSWLVNDTYKRKISEVGYPCVPIKDQLLVPDYEYLMSIMDVCDTLVREVHSQLDAKYT